MLHDCDSSHILRFHLDLRLSDCRYQRPHLLLFWLRVINRFRMAVVGNPDILWLQCFQPTQKDIMVKIHDGLNSDDLSRIVEIEELLVACGRQWGFRYLPIALVPVGLKGRDKDHVVWEIGEELFEILRSLGLEVEDLVRSPFIVFLDPFDDLADILGVGKGDVTVPAYEDNVGTWDLRQSIRMRMGLITAAFLADLLLPFGLPLEAGTTVDTIALAALEWVPRPGVRIHP